MSGIPPASESDAGYAQQESASVGGISPSEAAQPMPGRVSARLLPRLPLIARTYEGHEEHRQATWLELFFDLCFVVAVAALARAFHSDPTWPKAFIYMRPQW